MSTSNFRMVRRNVLRCMPNVRAVLPCFAFCSRKTVRMKTFWNSRTASEYRMPLHVQHEFLELFPHGGNSCQYCVLEFSCRSGIL